MLKRNDGPVNKTGLICSERAQTWGIRQEFLFFERRFCFGKWHSKMV